MHTVSYHEDSYRQIELIPEKNNLGIPTDIDHLVRTDSLHIPLQEINDILLPLSLNFFSEVKTGYSTQYSVKKNTIAFGFERLGIFIESHDDIVENIWLCLAPEFYQSQSSAHLLNALHTIGQQYGLLLIDWEEETFIRLSDLLPISNYLKEVFGFSKSEA